LGTWGRGVSQRTQRVFTEHTEEVCLPAEKRRVDREA
jgi:hypothetical protein